MHSYGLGIINWCKSVVVLGVHSVALFYLSDVNVNPGRRFGFGVGSDCCRNKEKIKNSLIGLLESCKELVAYCRLLGAILSGSVFLVFILLFNFSNMLSCDLHQVRTSIRTLMSFSVVHVIIRFEEFM